jgi:hypothetical protein
MKQHHHLAWPLYLTGLMVVVFPAVEFVLTVWPLSPGVLSWRYGTVGLLSRSIMTPMVGLAIILATATLLERTWVQRAVSVLGFVGAAALLLALGLFALDLLQFRNQVRPAAKTAFDVSSVMAVMKLFAGAVVLLAFGVSGRAMVRRAAAREPHRSAPAPLIARPGSREEAPPVP